MLMNEWVSLIVVDLFWKATGHDSNLEFLTSNGRTVS
jgi:hypothetical protein